MIEPSMASWTTLVANCLYFSKLPLLIWPWEGFFLIIIMVFSISYSLIIFICGLFICANSIILIWFGNFLRICFLSSWSFTQTWRIQTFITRYLFYWRNPLKTYSVVAHKNFILLFLIIFRNTHLFWRIFWLIFYIRTIMFGFFRLIAAFILVI
jgi:hypothetical protein